MQNCQYDKDYVVQSANTTVQNELQSIIIWLQNTVSTVKNAGWRTVKVFGTQWILQGGIAQFNSHRKDRPSVFESLGLYTSVLDQPLKERVGGVFQNALPFLKHPSLHHWLQGVRLHPIDVTIFADDFVEPVWGCDPQSAAPEHHSKQDRCSSRSCAIFRTNQ